MCDDCDMDRFTKVAPRMLACFPLHGTRTHCCRYSQFLELHALNPHTVLVPTADIALMW